MDLHRHQHKLLVEDAGQTTVEYAVVTAALICIVVALGAFWRSMESGLFVDHGMAAASHLVQNATGWIVDVFSY